MAVERSRLKSIVLKLVVCGIIAIVAAGVTFGVFTRMGVALGVPREYLVGNFNWFQLSPLTDKHMRVVLDPEVPSVEGERIAVTVFVKETGEPYEERWILAKAENGTSLSAIDTNSTGQGYFTYGGDGTILRITADGTYVPDVVFIFGEVPDQWVVGKQQSLVAALASGAVVAAVGVLVSKMARWI